jgi:hypothetical protein
MTTLLPVCVSTTPQPQHVIKTAAIKTHRPFHSHRRVMSPMRQRLLPCCATQTCALSSRSSLAALPAAPPGFSTAVGVRVDEPQQQQRGKGQTMSNSVRYRPANRRQRECIPQAPIAASISPRISAATMLWAANTSDAQIQPAKSSPTIFKYVCMVCCENTRESNQQSLTLSSSSITAR